MPKKIRVHELAKELGLTNKEALELCSDLGMDVKTHSSGIEEAQADRARRKAEKLGIIRDQQPEEPKKAKKAPAKKKAAPKKAAQRSEPPSEPVAPAAEVPTPEPAPAPAEPEVVEAAEPTEAPAPAPAPADEPVAPAEVPPAAAAAPTSPAPPRRATPPDPSKVVTSSGSGRPPRPASAPEAPAARRAPESTRRPDGPPPAPGRGPAGPTGAPGAPGAPTQGPPRRQAPPRPSPDMAPRSESGKPIPPPPGPPRGMSGRPIPPPPGLGGRGAAPTRAGGPGRPGRPSAPGRSAPPPAGGPGRGGPPPSGGPGRGGPGRPGGPAGRRPPRRKGRRRRNREELRPMDMPEYTPAEAPVPEGEVIIERATTPQDLGPKLNRTAADVVRFLMAEGEMVTATQSLTDDMIELFAVDVGAEVRLVDPGEQEEVALRKRLGVGEIVDDATDGIERPPVITVMGHVDHGKTKLLDQIRSANVVDGEAGGITQHIGAYQVEKDGRRLTFIDTPGHEAFSAMRARGANATDIVVLVVAADDGVMPQTIEALDHAKAADVPIVVAINKIDRENADPQRVMSELAERDLVPEAWGGDTIMVEISALQNIGIDDLLEQLVVVADVEELTADPAGRAMGVVLESHLDTGRGAVASLLVQRGTVKVGDPLVAGAAWGRVRALIDDKGNQVKEAGPSSPVEVLGLSDVAVAGDDFVVAPDDKTARQVSEEREHYQRVASISGTAAVATGGMKLEDIFTQIQAGEAATLNLIVKADVNGSLEAVTESLKKLERDEVKLAFARRGVGGVTKDDIQLAVATNATIIGFNVRPDRLARELAAQEGVEIRSYEIIYKLIEDIEAAMVGMLAPEFEEVVTGEAEVREIFRVPKVGAIAGCYVTNGTITRGSKVRFLREGTVIWKGAINSLRRFKDDVREVQAGYECGIGLSDFQDLKDGDVIETYEDREIARS